MSNERIKCTHPRCWAFDCDENCKHKINNQQETDHEEEHRFFTEQISILKLQTQVKVMETKNKELIGVLEKICSTYRASCTSTKLYLLILEAEKHLFKLKE